MKTILMILLFTIIFSFGVEQVFAQSETDRELERDVEQDVEQDVRQEPERDVEQDVEQDVRSEPERDVERDVRPDPEPEPVREHDERPEPTREQDAREQHDRESDREFDNYPFIEITSPTQTRVHAGEYLSIVWRGGNPSNLVDVYLIDNRAWAVAHVIESATQNDGHSEFELPHELPFDGPCGKEYMLYVGNTQKTNWDYGPEFTVICEETNPQKPTHTAVMKPIDPDNPYGGQVAVMRPIDQDTYELERIIEEQQHEINQLKREVSQLEKQIDELKEIAMEQLKIITQWIRSN